MRYSFSLWKLCIPLKCQIEHSRAFLNCIRQRGDKHFLDHLRNVLSTVVREHLWWEQNICGGDGYAGYVVSTPRRSGWQAWPALVATDAAQLTSPWLPHPSQFGEMFNPKEALSQMTLPVGVTSLLWNLEGHQSHLTSSEKMLRPPPRLVTL